MTPTKKRIAFVCPRFAEGNTVGGAETLLKALATRLASWGHEITFLTTCARNHFTWQNEVEPGTRTVDGMTVRFFPVKQDRDIALFLNIQSRICRNSTVSRDEEQAWLDNSVNSPQLCDFIRQQAHHFDAIIAGPYLFGLIYHAANAAPARTFLLPCLHDESFAYLAAFRELFRSVRGCVFNAEAEMRLAQRIYNLQDKILHVIGVGVDPASTQPETFRKQHNLPQRYVLYSGRREVLKGTPLLIDYIHTFRARTGIDVELVFTGSGELQIPPELAGKVRDLGFVSEADKRNAMAAATVFCQPSTFESLSIVLLEAWLSGTPVLVHAGSEVMRHHCEKGGGGLWFGNYPEFEEMLRLLLNNETLRSRMGKLGKAYAEEQYSWNAVDNRLTALLKSLD